MTAPTIRTATLADAPDLIAFWATAGENASRPDDTQEAVRALLERDPAATLVAEEDGRIVGTVIAGWDGWRAHLYRLAVHPDARRRGLATLLLEAAEARLAALGATRFDAMVLDDNGLGRVAWQRRGYVRQADWSRWVRTAPTSPLTE